MNSKRELDVRSGLVIGFVFVALAFVLGPSLAHASIELHAGDIIRFTNREGTTAGGEFGVQLNTGPGTWTSDLFRTFCIESDEYIQFNTAYEIKTIEPNAVEGGANVTPGGYDPLDARTAYLFWHFTNQTLASIGLSYDYTANSAQHVADANALQKAIWALEGELGGATNSFYNTADSWFNNLTTSQAEKDFYTSHVLAINPVGPNDGGVKQSMLFAVPEATALVIWSVLGLIGLYGVNCRSQQRLCHEVD